MERWWTDLQNSLNAPTGPPEKIIRPWGGGSSRSLEGGTQTQNFIDLVLKHR